MKKIYVTIFTIILLALVGCDNQNSSVTTQEGNFTAKQDTLSSANDNDIKNDLVALNVILNASNSEALELRDKIMKASNSGDNNLVKEVMKESKILQESTNAKLIAITLKSQEVQAIRIKIVEGNMKAIKIAEISTKDSPSAEDQQELAQLGQQLIALQSETSQKLDQLNRQYGQP